MKKVMFALLSVLVLAACSGEDKEPVAAKEEDSKVIENQNGNTVIKEKEEEKNETETEAETEKGASKEKTLEDVLNHFSKQGFQVGEKSMKAFEMVGAIDGFGIELNSEKVELYLYESDSEALKEIQANGSFNMDGFVIPALLNGNIALMGYEDHSETDKIVETFNSIK